MARDRQGLNLPKWASSSSALVVTPEAEGIDRDEGLPASYGIDLFYKVELWNQMLLEITALLLDIASHSILSWDSAQTYQHPSFVVGTNGNIYRSKQPSGGDLTSQNPTTDASAVYWERFNIEVPISTTTRRGIIEIATDAECIAGTDTERSVTPRGAKAHILAAIAALPRPLWI